MLRSGKFWKDDIFSTLHQPLQATWLQLKGWVKKYQISVNASDVGPGLNQILFSGCSRILRRRCLQRTSLCWKQILPKLPSWRLRFSLLMSSPIQFEKCLRSEQTPLQPTTTNKTNTDRGDQKTCICPNCRLFHIRRCGWGGAQRFQAGRAGVRSRGQGASVLHQVASPNLLRVNLLSKTAVFKYLLSKSAVVKYLLSKSAVKYCLDGNLYIQGPASV